MDPDFFGMRSPWVPRFNTDEITRPDQSERYANYASAISAGWMDAEEPRALEGLPPRKADAKPVPTPDPAGAMEGSFDDAA